MGVYLAAGGSMLLSRLQGYPVEVLSLQKGLVHLSLEAYQRGFEQLVSEQSARNGVLVGLEGLQVHL